MISIIMQARVGSTRLPAKILKEILGKTILELDIERCLQIKNIDNIIIATTTEPEADRIIEVCKKFPWEKVKYYQGSINDVLARHYEAAKQFGADILIRITSDCPLLDPQLIDDMIEKFLELRKETPPIDDLLNNKPPTYPHGLDAEIFTFAALEKAYFEAKDPYECEHVTPYIQRHPDLFKIVNYSQPEDQSSYRWTLDYPEDFEFIKTVYEHIYPKNPHFNRFDVIKLLKYNSEILTINRKYHR